MTASPYTGPTVQMETPSRHRHRHRHPRPASGERPTGWAVLRLVIPTGDLPAWELLGRPGLVLLRLLRRATTSGRLNP
jgi:hypothetical protein